MSEKFGIFIFLCALVTIVIFVDLVTTIYYFIKCPDRELRMFYNIMNVVIRQDPDDYWFYIVQYIEKYRTIRRKNGFKPFLLSCQRLEIAHFCREKLYDDNLIRKIIEFV